MPANRRSIPTQSISADISSSVAVQRTFRSQHPAAPAQSADAPSPSPQQCAASNQTTSRRLSAFAPRSHNTSRPSGDQFCPWSPGDGCNAIRHLHQLVPGIAACVEDLVVGIPNAVAEKVGSQELPDILNGVQLGRIGRKRQQHDVVRHLEPRRAVPTGTIQNQKSDGAYRDASADFCQVLVHGLDVHLWHDDRGTGAALRTDRPKQIRPFVTSIARGTRP